MEMEKLMTEEVEEAYNGEGKSEREMRRKIMRPTMALQRSRRLIWRSWWKKKGWRSWRRREKPVLMVQTE